MSILTNVITEVHAVKMKSVKTRRAHTAARVKLDTKPEKDHVIQVIYVALDSTTVTIELRAQIFITDLSALVPKDSLVSMGLNVSILTNAKIQFMIALLINNVSTQSAAIHAKVSR